MSSDERTAGSIPAWPLHCAAMTGLNETSNEGHPTDADGSAAPSRLPLLGSLIVGLACAYVFNFAVPEIFRLSWLAYLLFYLGLFFYLLYGLLIGAFMFRAGRRARPAPKSLLLVIGLVVVLATWAGGLYQEYRALPGSFADQTWEEIDGQITPEQMEDLRRGVAQAVHAHWQTHHPPGGFPGFLSWMVQGERIECPFVVKKGTHKLGSPQQGAGFLFRAVVSLGLLAFSILSQFMGLASSPPSAGGEEDEARSEASDSLDPPATPREHTRALSD